MNVMVVKMKRRILILIVGFLIVADVVFIAITFNALWSRRDRIEEYLRLKQSLEHIESLYPGKVNAYWTNSNIITFDISSDVTGADCYCIVQNFRENQYNNESLEDITIISFGHYAKTENYDRNLDVLSFRGLGQANQIFAELLVSHEATGDFLRLSSYRPIQDQFLLATYVPIELDDDSVFSKITEWRCKEGHFTPDQLSEIEARGIPVTVWKEDIS